MEDYIGHCKTCVLENFEQHSTGTQGAGPRVQVAFHDGQFTRTWNRTYIQSFVGLNGDPWGDYAQVIEHVFCRRFAGGISGQSVDTFRSSLPLVAKIICLAVHEVGGVDGEKEEEYKNCGNLCLLLVHGHGCGE